MRFKKSVQENPELDCPLLNERLTSKQKKKKKSVDSFNIKFYNVMLEIEISVFHSNYTILFAFLLHFLFLTLVHSKKHYNALATLKVTKNIKIKIKSDHTKQNFKKLYVVVTECEINYKKICVNLFRIFIK